jgi:hypothetical protein
VKATLISKNIVGGGSGGSLTLPISQPTSITLTEKAGSRTVENTDRTTHCTLTATIQEPTPAPSGYQLGTVLHLQISSDGVNFGDLGVYAPTRTGAMGGFFTTSIDIPDILVYTTVQTWYVRTWAATGLVEPGESLAITSAGYNDSAVSLPSATTLGAVQIAPYSLSTNLAAYPYNMISKDGVQYWSIPYILYDDSGCLGDVNAFFVRVTAQSLDSAKSAISAEQPYAGTQVSGNIQTCDPLIGPYGPDSSGISTNNIAYVRLKFYVCNRLDQTAASFTNPDCATLETGYTVTPSITGQIIVNTGSIDVMVAQSGGVPTGQMDGVRVTKNLGSGITNNGTNLKISYGAGTQDDGSGNLTVKVGGVGVTIDTGGNIAAKLGAGTQNDGSNGITLNIGGGLAFSGSQATVSTSNGVQVSSGSVQAKFANGLTLNIGSLQVSLGNGLGFSGSSVVPVTGNGIGISGTQIVASLGNGLAFSGSNIQVNAGNGLTMSGTQLVANLGNGVTLSGGAITLNLGSGLTMSGASVVANLGNGVTTSAGAITLNLGNGLQFSGSATTINAGSGLSVGIQLTIPSNGVSSSMIASLDVSRLNAGTMTVGSGGMTFSGTGGILVSGGGNVSVTPGKCTGDTVVAGGGGVYVFTTQVISNSGAFIGAGVNTPSYGHAASGFNPFSGGSQYFGATFTFQDLAGTTHSVIGGVLVS